MKLSLQHCSRSLSHVTLWSRLWPLQPEHTPLRACSRALHQDTGVARVAGPSLSSSQLFSPLPAHRFRPELFSPSSQHTALTTDRTWSAPGALNCLHCTVLHYTALHCTVLHCAPPPSQVGAQPGSRAGPTPCPSYVHCTELHCTALHSAGRCSDGWSLLECRVMGGGQGGASGSCLVAPGSCLVAPSHIM